MIKIKGSGWFYCLFYTVLIAVISAVITTWYINSIVLNSDELERTVRIDTRNKIDNSPLLTKDTIVEVFSYGCHFCELTEAPLQQLSAQLPSGKRLIRLHIGESSGLGSYLSMFSALSVMGIEGQHRQALYDAVLKENQDLSTKEIRDTWLTTHGINLAEYYRAEASPEAIALRNLANQVSAQYAIRATPSYIVGNQWVMLADRDWPAMGERLIATLVNGVSPQ